MNQVQYYFQHCLQTGWREMWNNFKMWRDLLSNNYSNYSLLKEDDPYEECLNWFWYGLNADETYPKEFLESLNELMDRIDRGEEKLYPIRDVTELFRDLYEDLNIFDTEPKTLQELLKEEDS